MLRDCRALSLKVSVLPRLADVLGPAVEIDDVEGVTVLGVNPPWLPRSSRAIKRGMDLLIATPLLILVAPLLALLAIAIKLDSRGPVFFAQERVGTGQPALPPVQAAHDDRRCRASAARSWSPRARMPAG